MNTAVRAFGERRSLALASLVGFSLFQCAKSTELAQTSVGAMGSVYIARFVEIAAWAVVAALSRRRRISTDGLLAVAVPFMMVSVVATEAAALLHAGVLGTSLAYATGILYGISSGLYRLAFILAIAAFGFAASALALGLSKLLTNCLLLAFAVFGFGLQTTSTNALLLASTFLVVFSAWRLRQGSPSAVASPSSAGRAPSPPRAPSFPSGKADWAMLLSAAFAFDFLFGVIAQASSAEAADNFALYDGATGLLLAVFDLLLVMFLLLDDGRFTFPVALTATAVLYATGIALYPWAWETGNPLGGALIRAGFDCGFVLLGAFVARRAHESPDRSVFYFSLFFCLSTVYPGRAVGSALSDAAGALGVEFVGRLSTGSLWAICMLCAAVLLAVGRGAERASSRSASLGSAAEEPTPEGALESRPAEASCVSEGAEETVAEEFFWRIDEFSERFRLSTREKEVLLALLHGNSHAGIAQKLYLSPGTVKTYVSRVYGKVGVGSKQELVDCLDELFSADRDRAGGERGQDAG